MRKTLSSRRISSDIASRKASRTVIDTISVPSGQSGAVSGVALTCAGAGVSEGFGSARPSSPESGSGIGVLPVPAGAASASCTFSPSSNRSAIGALTFTPSVPSATMILPIVPSSTASNSIVALSVSISARMSPEETVSPSLTSHLASVPSSIVGDRAGIRISVGMLLVPQF